MYINTQIVLHYNATAVISGSEFWHWIIANIWLKARSVNNRLGERSIEPVPCVGCALIDMFNRDATIIHCTANSNDWKRANLCY